MIFAVSDAVWLALIGIVQIVVTAYVNWRVKSSEAKLLNKCEVIDKSLGQATERREAIAEAIISNQTVARTDAMEAKK